MICKYQCNNKMFISFVSDTDVIEDMQKITDNIIYDLGKKGYIRTLQLDYYEIGNFYGFAGIPDVNTVNIVFEEGLKSSCSKFGIRCEEVS